ncbi:MAG: amino acid ABC transporter permease [Actinomycetota bacterium]|nr:amino acid ABC transporter permease [Actinomycetota bacterium]
MTAPVFVDALGPRGRRQARIASLVALAVIAAGVAVAVGRLREKGQLDGDLYRPFTEWAALEFYVIGLLNTLKVAALAMVLAMAIGVLMALLRLTRSWVSRILAVIYVEFFRGLPLYLLIIFCAFALPRYGVDISLLTALALGLVVYNSSILAEVFRAGILSLDRGQTEAAYALGMGYWQTMLLVLIPQAARRMLPAIVSQLVTLLKDTSLGVVIAYEELLRRSQIAGEFFRNTLQSVAFAAVIYILINYALSRLAQWLEVRQRRRLGAGAIAVAGVEDLAVIGAQGEAATAVAAAGEGKVP